MMHLILGGVCLLIGLRLLWPSFRVFREDAKRFRPLPENALFDLSAKEPASVRSESTLLPRSKKAFVTPPVFPHKPEPEMQPTAFAPIGLGTHEEDEHPSLPSSNEPAAKPLLSKDDDDRRSPQQGQLGF